jgi:hypothetical protein
MQAYAVLNGLMLQQANLKAYIDIFYWTALITVFCIPGALLLKKVITKGQIALH